MSGPAFARAQKIELVSLSAQYMPSADMPVPPGGRAQVASYDVAANAPVPLGPKTFFLPGLGYHADAVSFSDTPPGFVDRKAFHSLEVALMLVQLFPRDNECAVREKRIRSQWPCAAAPADDPATPR